MFLLPHELSGNYCRQRYIEWYKETFENKTNPNQVTKKTNPY